MTSSLKLPNAASLAVTKALFHAVFQFANHTIHDRSSSPASVQTKASSQKYKQLATTMTTKTGQRARAKANDSTSRKDGRELPLSLTRIRLNKKPAAQKPHQVMMSTSERHNLLLDLPPELRNIIYEYCVTAPDAFEMVSSANPTCPDLTRIEKSHMPDLLMVSRQVREGALPIFYSSNDINFSQCHAKYITRWLFRGVHPKHLKYIRSIDWTCPMGELFLEGLRLGIVFTVQTWAESLEEHSLHLSSAVVLLELGLLGQCKVKMALFTERRLHVACMLQELTKKMIARNRLTETHHAWNEKSVPGADDVAGLSYAVLKEWGRMLPHTLKFHLEDRDAPAPGPAPGTFCTKCLPIYDADEYYPDLPWVRRDDDAKTSVSKKYGQDSK